VKVLLIRKGHKGDSSLTAHLAAQGCECQFATSHHEVAGLTKQNCDLVLGPIKLDSESLYPLIAQLHGSRTTLFYYFAVEDGCWWLPALWLGANCFGAPAIHNTEFVSVLDETIEQIRIEMQLPAWRTLTSTPRISESAMTFPFPRKTQLPVLPRSAKVLSIATRKLG